MNMLSDSEAKSCSGIASSADVLTLRDRVDERLRNRDQGLPRTSRVVLLGVITGSVRNGTNMAVMMMFGLYAL